MCDLPSWTHQMTAVTLGISLGVNVLLLLVLRRAWREDARWRR